MKPKENQSPIEFWEEVYANASPRTKGQPSAALARFASDRLPGHALELGCAKGDDAVWLANKGWTVVAVDISTTALSYAGANAQAHGVLGKIDFQQHDLTHSFPEGEFDLVSAMFLQTPFEFARETILKQAASSLKKGGLFLAVTHGSRPSWSWDKSNTPFPLPQKRFQDLDLIPTHWRDVFVGNEERIATGPDGQEGSITDTIVCLERR